MPLSRPVLLVWIRNFSVRFSFTCWDTIFICLDQFSFLSLDNILKGPSFFHETVLRKDQFSLLSLDSTPKGLVTFLSLDSSPKARLAVSLDVALKDQFSFVSLNSTPQGLV